MNEKKKLLTTIGAAVGVAILLLVGCYFPMKSVGVWPFGGKDCLREQSTALKKEIAAFQTKAKKRGAMKEEIASLGPVQTLAEQLLPKEKSPYDLVRAIRTKAEKAGVNQTKLEPKAAAAAPVGRMMMGPKKAAGAKSYEEWSFTIEMEGTFDQIGGFINQMEEFQLDTEGGRKESRFFAVKDIEVTASEKGLVEGSVHKCKLIMVTYRYTGETEAGPKPAAPATPAPPAPKTK